MTMLRSGWFSSSCGDWVRAGVGCGLERAFVWLGRWMLLAFCSSLLMAQGGSALGAASAAPDAAPVVDVHASPYRSAIYYKMNIGHHRFDMRDATILDLIAFAYGQQDNTILGGPTWIDFDRFDVVAKVDSLEPPTSIGGPPDPSKPPVSPYDQLRPVLQQVLTSRFHLKYHTEDRPLPGYVFRVGKDGVKFTEAKDSTAPPNCRAGEDKPTPGQFALLCTSQTIPQLVKMFSGVFPHPAVDQTGLKKSYDFTLKLTMGQMQTRDDYIKLYVDAFAKLGLVVTPETVPQPAIVVEQVDRPTANAPDMAKLMPPLPDMEFEVATIKPAADTDQRRGMRFGGSELTYTSWSLQELLGQSFALPTGAMLANAPPWINVARYTILVKLPPEIDARAAYQDQDQINHMLQKLIVDRFQVKYHWGEQTQDGWVLLAGTPRLKKADPNERTSCSYGPPEGEKDMHPAGSAFDNQSHCQNVTMAQFADVLQNLAKSEIKNHVRDETGLEGGYDFTFYYSSTAKLRADTAAAVAAAKDAGASTSDPVGGMNIQDAFKKELGLRLEKRPGTYPALVLDHIEQRPTEN